MRYSRIAQALALSALLSLVAAAPERLSGASPRTAIEQALLGEWSGYLEYRDYSEAATSTKRVQLPAWLKVTAAGDGLQLHYIYDDGPDKVVDQTERLAIDLARHTYTTSEAGHPAHVYRAEGLDSLRDGRGTLTLTGSGKDDGKPADERVTMVLRRNMIEWLLEVRPSGSQQPFAFRHLYRFTRSMPPVVTSRRKD